MAVSARLLLVFAVFVGGSLSQSWDCNVGQGIDLTPLRRSADWAITLGGGTEIYSLNLCGPLVTACSSGISDPSGCQTYPGNGQKTTLGKSSTMKASFPTGGGGVKLSFGSGDLNRAMTITFTCNPAAGAGNPIYVSESPKLTYNFNWLTQYACPGQGNTGSGSGGSTGGNTPPGSSEGGLSGGSIFLLILFISVVVYVGAGAVYNYRREERGVRLIPQVELWSSVPGLVGDGYRYLVAKVRGGNGGYSSI